MSRCANCASLGAAFACGCGCRTPYCGQSCANAHVRFHECIGTRTRDDNETVKLVSRNGVEVVVVTVVQARQCNTLKVLMEDSDDATIALVHIDGAVLQDVGTVLCDGDIETPTLDLLWALHYLDYVAVDKLMARTSVELVPFGPDHGFSDT